MTGSDIAINRNPEVLWIVKAAQTGTFPEMRQNRHSESDIYTVTSQASIIETKQALPELGNLYLNFDTACTLMVNQFHELQYTLKYEAIMAP